MESELISVIITVYNREKYLNRCIDSILDQEDVLLEIILIDDGSTDRSASICDEYATNHRNVRVFHQQNKGISSARNVGLDKADGQYIVFADDDDFLPKDSMNTLLSLQKENNADLVIGNYAEYTDEGEHKSVFTFPDKYCNRVLNNRDTCELLFYSDRSHVLMVSWGKLFKKEIWDGLRFDENITKSEDQFVFPILMEKCHSIYFTDKVVYNQIFSNTSISRSKVSRRHLFHSEGVAVVTDYLIEKGYYDIALFKFGLGTRHLIYMKKMLRDDENQKEINRQYARYKKLARMLFSHLNFKNKLRMVFFYINFDLYALLREGNKRQENDKISIE